MAESAARRGPWPKPIVAERRATAPNCSWEHAHKQTRWHVIALALLVLVLTVAVLILTVYVSRLNDYVDSRGEFRDAEAMRIERSIDRAVCDILREFPPGDERADRLRVRYGCPVPEVP